MHTSHLSLEITYRATPALAVTLNCRLSYRTDDPLAVTLVLDTDGERPVRWVFGRDLLAEGMTCASGGGEVTLWPAPGDEEGPSVLCLRVGDARTALFELPVAPVADWLADTYALVPAGSELDGTDWDLLLEPAE
ncbi:SsgA family sporulation/cell division regulator [Streptomyces flaveolus]|uniref:SsgA family sporulation/cell division regulator n=1 Tax=Streptomyces flaveolus TaxID=67297 RepID=UPI001670BD15|nr:SsgA family sporulation/cell division regulator [Streptomyces flaveolus]GGQ98649.1 hypothetical protein GCM10010216_71390 [Streptomyces flaveolus]